VAGVGAEAAGVGVAAGPLPASPATTALRIWVGTWNLGNHAPPARMDGWLPDPSEGFDVVVVSAQECGYKGDRAGADWYEHLRAHLGPAYVVLGQRSMRHIRMLVSVRAALAPCARLARLEAHGAGLLRLYGNKGAVGCTLWLGPTSLCFVGAHLAAHAHHLARRHEDLRQLLAGLQLGVGTADLQAEVHHLFLLGDLNYRLQRNPSFEGPLPKKDDAHHAEVLGKVERREWPSLLQSDQLRAAVRAGFLHGFAEGPPLFAPTFKLVVGSRLTYTSSRVPSYCDRVLWHSAAEHAGRLRQASYASCDTLLSSDHAAVMATFDLGVPSPLALPPLVGTAGTAAAPPLRLRLTELAVRGVDPTASQLAAGQRAAAAAAAQGARLYVTLCGTHLGAAHAPDAPCSDAVAARPEGQPRALHATWAEAQLPCAPVQSVGSDVAAVKEQLLVVLLRDLDLLGGDDLLGVATVPLLQLRGLDVPMRFRVPLLHATRLCGELEGSLVLSRS